MVPVDAVAPVHASGDDQQPIELLLIVQRVERGWDRRTGVAAEHSSGIEVVGVARVAGDRAGVEPQPVVVVRSRHQRTGADGLDAGWSGGGEGSAHIVEQQLNRVWPVLGIGEIGHGQGRRELVRGKGGDHGGPSGLGRWDLVPDR